MEIVRTFVRNFQN